MCNPLPGVRCTPHARVRFSVAQSALDKATEDYDKIKNGRNTQKKVELLDRIDEARAKVNIREREYYASAGGIQELQEALKAGDYSLGDAESIEARLDLAIYDKETQTLASKMVKGLQTVAPAHRVAQENLITQEREALTTVANLENKHGPTSYEAIHARKQAKTISQHRKRFDEAVRRYAAGITHNENTLVKGPEAYDMLAKRGKKKSDTQIFIPLQSESFGRASNYLPFGAYAKVTSLQHDNRGSLNVIIENCHSVTLPSGANFLKSVSKN